MSDNNNNNDEYEKVCYVCRRTESKAGKMISMPGGLYVCPDCMQKTFDAINNNDIDYNELMKGIPNMPNMGMFGGFNMMGNNMSDKQKVKKKKDKKKKVQKEEALASQLTEEQQRKYDYFFLEAMRMKGKNEYDAAFCLLQHCLDINPNASSALYEISQYYMFLRQVPQGQAALEQAEDAFRRMKELYDKGSLSEIKWVEIQSKLEQARSLEEIARKNLDDCRLYAPYDGVISEKMGESGLNVMSGVPVARLVSVNQLKVKVSVPETEISNIALSWEATIQVPALNDQCFKGTVIEKGIVANPLSRSYDVKIRIDNPDKSLMPGMVVKVGLRSPEEKRSFILPAYIVQLDENNRTFVWVNNGGKAQRRFVTCGDYTAHGVTVVSGLDAGDEVIVEGQQKVCENVMLSL